MRCPLGHFQTSSRVPARSVFPSTADMLRLHPHVGFVPGTAVSNCGKTAHLFNNLVGSVQQAQWHVEAKRICRSQVDD